MLSWSTRDFEFSKSQAEREFNCPEYKSNFEKARLAVGSKWPRNENQNKSRSKLTISDVPNTKLFVGLGKFKENVAKPPEYRRKPKKCVTGCRKYELAQNGLLDMTPTGSPDPLDSVVFSVQPPDIKGCNIGKQRKIGLYVRSFE